MPYKSQPIVTRPANTTAYTAGDVVGGAIPFSDLLHAQSMLITSAGLRVDVAAVPAGMTSFRLHLYERTPPSAIADNAAWTLAAGDRDSYLGYIDLGAPATLGASLFAQVDQVNKHVIAGAAAGLFGYLVTNGAFTPAAGSEVYMPTLYAVDI